MEKENSLEMTRAIQNYAQTNGIILDGTTYQTYSMLKHPHADFPENKMFLSNNAKGTLKKKNVTIVALNQEKISHFQSDNVLERSIDKRREYMIRRY